jgi:hypothetical protein
MTSNVAWRQQQSHHPPAAKAAVKASWQQPHAQGHLKSATVGCSSLFVFAISGQWQELQYP